MGTIPYRGELLNQFVLWSGTTDSGLGVVLTYTYVDHQFRHENIWYSFFSLILVGYLGSS